MIHASREVITETYEQALSEVLDGDVNASRFVSMLDVDIITRIATTALADALAFLEDDQEEIVND